VDLAVAWLKIKDPDFEVPMADAISAAREMPLAEKAGAPVGNQNAKNNSSGTTIVPKQDRGRSYHLRRIRKQAREEVIKRIVALPQG
jgi:hypothetical protein